MKKIVGVIALLFLFNFYASSQVEIGGIVMPKVMKVGDQYIKMNGGGVRQKYWIDLYIGVLYVTNKTSDADKIMNADEPMAIKLRVVSGMVSNSKLEDALRDGIDKSTGGNISPLKDRMEKMISIGFKDDVEDGDVFDLIYVPGKGTTLQKNNAVLVTVPGLDFKKALFGVWLCDDPAQESLKKKMLGL